MIPSWTDREVRQALGLPLEGSSAGLEFPRISTDTRTVGQGDLFLALRGERFDGHDFVRDALAKGAAGAVVDGSFPSGEGEPLYQVEDTLLALGNLARFRRGLLGARVVGITGSSGKTSTKELLRAALEGSVRVHATRRNFNNRVGLPQTILAAPADTQVLVLEMGTNELGEIGALTEIAGPDIGLITTVSETHLEKLGSLDGVLEEKLDLLRGLPEGGLALVGDEPALLEEKARGVTRNLMVAGWSQRVRPEHRPEHPTLQDNGCYRFFWRGEPVAMGMPGRHSVANALLALAVADALGVQARDAAARVGQVAAGGMRSEVRTLGPLTLLVDCYNSNPQSLRAALELLASLPTQGPRVAVLGSMLELGEASRALHRRELEHALTHSLDLILATGHFAEVAGEMEPGEGGTELLVAQDLDQALELLLESLRGTGVVLLKASRGVAMERLIPGLEERFGPGRAA